MNLKEIRKAKGITQTELANKLGVKRTTLSMWELGESAPTVRILPALAAALGCSIDELFREPEQTAGEG